MVNLLPKYFYWFIITSYYAVQFMYEQCTVNIVTLYHQYMILYKRDTIQKIVDKKYIITFVCQQQVDRYLS